MNDLFINYLNLSFIRAQGEGGARAAQGDHGAAEDEARLGRQRVGRHQEMHLRSVLPPGQKFVCEIIASF